MSEKKPSEKILEELANHRKILTDVQKGLADLESRVPKLPKESRVVVPHETMRKDMGFNFCPTCGQDLRKSEKKAGEKREIPGKKVEESEALVTETVGKEEPWDVTKV